MKLSKIADELGLDRVNKRDIGPDAEITSGYVCDLLSQVLASVKENSIWITVQSHMNIIGVAVMAGIPAIVVCEGHDVPSDVIEKADDEEVAIFKSKDNGFQVCGKLSGLGIQ